MLRCSIFVLHCSILASVVGSAAGCYAPSPPPGAYSCRAGGACPDGQHCICGQCVEQDDQAACSFRVTAAPAAEARACAAGRAVPIADEHARFPLTI